MNKKLLAMMGKRNELKNQAKEILNTAQKEDRPITDEEKATLTDVKSKISQWDDTIKELADLFEDSAPAEEPVN